MSCPRMCHMKASFDLRLNAPAVAITINDATVAARPKSRLFHTLLWAHRCATKYKMLLA